MSWRYEATHFSKHDGSDAMLIIVHDNDTITLRNENGDEWTDPSSEWEEMTA